MDETATRRKKIDPKHYICSQLSVLIFSPLYKGCKLIGIGVF